MYGLIHIFVNSSDALILKNIIKTLIINLIQAFFDFLI